MKKESIYKLTKYITTFFSVVMIICFIVQLARIYFGDNSPMFSRDLVGGYLLQILPFIILWIIAIIVSFVFSVLTNDNKKMLVKSTNEAKLKLIENNINKNTDNPNYQSLLKSHKKMKIALIISLVIYLFCLIMISLYIFNPSHFLSSGNLSSQAIEMVANLWPFCLIALITGIVYTYYVDYESKLAIGYATSVLKEEGRVKNEYKEYKYKKLIINIARLAIVLIAVILIIVGVVAGEHQRVFQKAINICTECIGLG